MKSGFSKSNLFAGLARLLTSRKGEGLDLDSVDIEADLSSPNHALANMSTSSNTVGATVARFTLSTTSSSMAPSSPKSPSCLPCEPPRLGHQRSPITQKLQGHFPTNPSTPRDRHGGAMRSQPRLKAPQADSYPCWHPGVPGPCRGRDPRRSSCTQREPSSRDCSRPSSRDRKSARPSEWVRHS